MPQAAYRIDDTRARGGWKVLLFYLWFPFLFIYCELLFFLFCFHRLSVGFAYAAAFAVPAGLLCALVCGLLPKRASHAVAVVLSFLIVLFYSVHLIYFRLFRQPLMLFTLFSGTGQVLEFPEQIGSSILSSAGCVLLLLLPAVLFAVFSGRLVRFGRRRWWMSALLAAGAALSHVVCLLLLLLPGTALYTPYDLYYHTNAPLIAVENYGLLTTARLDVRRTLFGFEENAGTAEKLPDVKTDAVSSDVSSDPSAQEQPVDRSPNILPIDFDSLIAQEQDETLRQMHQYFQSVEPTRKNQYTGMFQDCNLILLTAESFSPYAVDRELTPTLYKLTHEGFVFNNFYTPSWGVSTSDGEYVACTGLIPKSGVWSLYESGKNKNFMPFALGSQFQKLGCTPRAYHNHTFNYYHRDVSHPNLGYIYKGLGNGLNVKETWPESDLEMIEATLPEYIGEKRFHTYYMTVSGHMLYTFSGNYIASKNRNLVEHLPYSEGAKAYLACNIELDRALQKLIEELEKAGIAEKTVIALSPDHYPYGLPKESLDELAGHEVEENFELYKSTFILWKEGMETTVVDKPCSSLDILPTLSNLFGLPYDSRLLMGQDILSDAPGLVIFANRSFITDCAMYNSQTKQLTPTTGAEIPEGYVTSVNKTVNQKFIYSAKILDHDYYRHVLEN